MADDDAPPDGAPVDEVVALLSRPLEQFVSARSARVKELRAEGRRREATALSKVRKPVRLVWVVGEVARRDPAEAVATVAVADEVARAMAGEGDGRAALARLREAVARAVDAGGAIDPAVDRGGLEEALRSVLADPAGRAAWAEGRLLALPTGDGASDAASPSDGGAQATAGPPPPEDATAPGPGGAAGEPEPVGRRTGPAQAEQVAEPEANAPAHADGLRAQHEPSGRDATAEAGAPPEDDGTPEATEPPGWVAPTERVASPEADAPPEDDVTAEAERPAGARGHDDQAAPTAGRDRNEARSRADEARAQADEAQARADEARARAEEAQARADEAQARAQADQARARVEAARAGVAVARERHAEAVEAQREVERRLAEVRAEAADVHRVAERSAAELHEAEQRLALAEAEVAAISEGGTGADGEADGVAPPAPA